MEYNEKTKQTMINYQKTLKQINARIKPDLYEEILNYSRATGMSIRQLILVSIEEYRKNHPLNS